jgi:hypothetical protein
MVAGYVRKPDARYDLHASQRQAAKARPCVSTERSLIPSVMPRRLRPDARGL